MNRAARLAALLFALFVVLAACGKPASVGDESLLDFEEEEARRLGGRSPEPEPTTEEEGRLDVGAESPTPAGEPSPPPKPPEQFFDIFLVAQSPFYEAQGPGVPRGPATEFQVPVGFTIRVTNQDDTEERPERTFTATNGAFTSGTLRLGQVWEQPFNVTGTWQIEDACCPFIFAKLEIVA